MLFRSGKSLPNAIENGYSRAFTTILDANLTTLFTAVILLMVGTGPIKGFAVTLSIGIITSMFSSLFLTRLIFDILMRFSFFKSLKMCRLFAKPKIDFLAMRYISGVISFILIVGSIIFIAWQSKEILGIDFTGGTRMTFDYESRVDSNELKNELQETYGFEDAKISYKSSGDDDKIEIVVRSEALDSNESSVKTAVSETLNTAFPDLKLQGGDERTLGGLIGQQFTKYAIIAIILALTGTVLYISARFEFAFAIAAIIAIIHDVIISTGVFVCLGRELSLPVIAALLTIIGYSLNDTIVVFDRIREDLTLETEKGYHDIINLSINQTMSRTILTSVTTLLVLIVLFSLGGVAINDFVLVMLIGVLVGTYSSIFVASPIVAVWHRKIGAKVKN